MTKVSININGEKYSEDVEDRTLLVHFIRDHARLRGTHIGCDTGHCGACTVLLNGRPVKSCQILAVQADGESVETVESLEGSDGKLSIEQEAFRDHFAMQCGYCTSGFLMMTHHLIREYPELSREEIREKLHGNYCMCTGYQQIVDAVQDAQKKFNEKK
ncbi:MAG: (2Fe-2S)-binding protein [Thermoplasmataceae archaeon]|jgi:aerobic-type carbon monoxide dehydrogenase small subunit (CoxS/CutS family)